VSTPFPSEPMTGPGVQDSPWASGLTVFAAAVMMISGVWHAFAGIGALVNDKVYVSTPRYIYSFDLTAWGWILIILGITVGAAGFAVLLAATWARVVGIVVASLSLIANFNVATGAVLAPSLGPTRTEADFAAHIARTVDTDPEAAWVKRM